MFRRTTSLTLLMFHQKRISSATEERHTRNESSNQTIENITTPTSDSKTVTL
ncbi:hypothetical protein LINPERPRIM_LOCUS36944 [Linum perenne]